MLTLPLKPSNFITFTAFLYLVSAVHVTDAAPVSPRNITYVDNIHNASSTDVIIVYPLSGYYAPLQRALYWSIIAFTILGLGNVWLITAAFGTAMTYSSVAAVHAIAIYAVRSREYYDADALAIWEILFCTSVLLPSWLAHYKRLRSTTAQIVLRLWGALMFIGGVVIVCQLIKVNNEVVSHQNNCVAQLPTNVTSYGVFEWQAQEVCRWTPYENATQPMRDINEIVILRSTHKLAKWTDILGEFAVGGGGICIAFIAISFLWPESKSLAKHRKEQLQKLRKHKRAKGNHPADTIQMPAAWCIGIVTLVFSELVLHLVPVSEAPRAFGQWGPWVAVILVFIAVLVNHYLEAPIEQMHESLGKVLGPLVWFRLEWRGQAPTRAQQRQAEKAKRQAERETAERERKSRMRTAETQTEVVELAMMALSADTHHPVRRCSI